MCLLVHECFIFKLKLLKCMSLYNNIIFCLCLISFSLSLSPSLHIFYTNYFFSVVRTNLHNILTMFQEHPNNYLWLLVKVNLQVCLRICILLSILSVELLKKRPILSAISSLHGKSSWMLRSMRWVLVACVCVAKRMNCCLFPIFVGSMIANSKCIIAGLKSILWGIFASCLIITDIFIDAICRRKCTQMKCAWHNRCRLILRICLKMMNLFKIVQRRKNIKKLVLFRSNSAWNAWF